MKLADSLKATCVASKQAKKEKEESALKAALEAEIAKMKGEILYCDNHFDELKSEIVQILSSKPHLGHLVLDNFRNSYNISRISIFLKHRLNEIAEWLRSEGFRVVAKEYTVVGTDCDRDNEGGPIYGTEWNVYGPQILISWDIS